MDEKVYKTIGACGAINLALGICTVIAGIASGVLFIITGAKLLKSRKKMLF